MTTVGSSCLIFGCFVAIFIHYGGSEPTDILRHQISERIWIHVYSAARTYDRIPYLEGAKDVIELPQYKANKTTTILYFPGWSENPQDVDSVNYVTDALLQRNDVNVLVLDYSESLQGTYNLQYVRSYMNASTIGYLVGKWITQLSNHLPNLDKKLRLVGHSMGSHIMSFATNVYGKGKLRITALDPAYPLYFGPFAHLTAVDGSFVDIIHTDAGMDGHPDSLGHADFFPNNGVREQPFCGTPADNATGGFCSHHMSWRFWAESAKPGQENIFVATKCNLRSPCTVFSIPGTCTCLQNGNMTAHMGYAVNINTRGNFYLKTNSTPPFGLGSSLY